MEGLLRFTSVAVARSMGQKNSFAGLSVLNRQVAAYTAARKRPAAQFAPLIFVLVLLVAGCNGGVAPAPKFTVALPNGGQAIDAGESPTLTATITNDRTGSVSWAITSGPGSLGTPSTTTNGVTTSTVVYTAPKTVNGPTQVSITITAGDPATYTLTFTVDAPPALTGGTLPSGTEGTAYSETPTETGGEGVLTWSISAGSLPAGLMINSTTGAITGKPTGPAGTSNFTIQVVDQSKAILGFQTASAPFSLTINNYPPPALSPASGALPGGMEGSSYNATILATGGNQPFTFTISSGSVPTGLTASASPTGLLISGDPTGPPCSPCLFSVKAVDSSNPPQSVTNNYSRGTGTFAFGTDLIIPATTAGFAYYPVTEIAVTSTTLTDLATGGSSTVGSYTLDTTTGRGTITLNNTNTFGDTSLVFYVVGNADSSTSTNKILILQMTATNPETGVLEQ